MNSEISVSYSSDQSVSESLAAMHQSTEDENSVIIWSQNQSDNLENVSLNMNNNEDFIEIDMLSDWADQDESHEDSGPSSPLNITADDSNISNSIFQHDSNNIINNEDFMPVNVEANKAQEILINHQNCSNANLKDEEKQKLFDAKLKNPISLRNSANISCYIDGIVAILQFFNKIDCYIEKFAQITNNCKCTPSLRKGEVTPLSHYLLEASGAKCENCSMDFILDKLNNIFLKNIARAEFITVQQIINSCRSDIEVPIGATNISCHSSFPNIYPEKGWLRKWLLKHLGDGVVAGIVYNDLINNNYNCRPCNKVIFRLITGYNDEEFHLTIPVESIKDEIIEDHLLQEESINVLKSNILKCQHHQDDFETILKQSDERFSEMNVLGQIIGTFREKSSDSFRGFVPEEVHHIKIPNMHRNGVMLVMNI